MFNNGNGNGSNGIPPYVRWYPSLFRLKQRPDITGPFRRLALQLHYDLAEPEQPRSVLLASPVDLHVCAQSAIMLSCCLAEETRKPVLLIDANPGSYATSQLMNSTHPTGFSEALANPGSGLEQDACRTTYENLSFLAAGSSPALVTEASSIRAVLDQATQKYGFVVLAGGSVLNDSLTRAIAPHVGCVLLLGVENETHIDDLDAAQNALIFGKARRIALVLSSSGGSSR
jgi:hypothetical protein